GGAVVAAGVVAASLVLVGLFVARSGQGWLAAMGGLSIVLLLAGSVLLEDASRTLLVKLVTAPADPSLGDWLRIAGTTVDLALLLALVGLGVGLFRREIRLPLLALLALPAT